MDVTQWGYRFEIPVDDNMYVHWKEAFKQARDYYQNEPSPPIWEDTYGQKAEVHWADTVEPAVLLLVPNHIVKHDDLETWMASYKRVGDRPPVQYDEDVRGYKGWGVNEYMGKKHFDKFMDEVTPYIAGAVVNVGMDNVKSWFGMK